MTCYDISFAVLHNREQFEQYAKENDIDFTLVEESTLDVEIEETDLLFIDTEHTYSQLLNELTLHGDKARKYIVLHDTATFPALKDAINKYIETISAIMKESKLLEREEVSVVDMGSGK